MRDVILWGGFVIFHAVLLFAAMRGIWSHYTANVGSGGSDNG